MGADTPPDDALRRPARPIPAPGAPPPGTEAVFWTARGARTGSQPSERVGIGSRTIGIIFFALWRLAGVLAWPAVLLCTGGRRHTLRLPTPEPGWTWMHGASAGEHVAARALAGQLERVWRTSSSWRTPIPDAFPAPLDLPWLVGRWLDRARPIRLILIEAELWPGWLVACRRRGIPVAVVNARPGRGTSRWRRIRPLWRWLTAGVTFIGQDETGDLKLSTELREATVQLGRDALIAASTRPGDEAHVLRAWATLSPPLPLLVIAPRHLERIDEVIEQLDASGATWARRSEGFTPQHDVLLLDTMGELSSLYAQAQAAFVGGTFDERIGGHSPAEAFAAGIPVVHGPHTHANPTAWTAGIAIAVQSPSALAAAFQQALSVGPRSAPVHEGAIRCAARLPPGRLPAERLLRPWALPLAPLWTAWGRHSPPYSDKPQQIGIPVISVGGLVAGGAGCTPVSHWLAERLPDAWVVSGGYRRARRGAAVRIGRPGDDLVPGFLGDELEMIRRRGVPVVSAPDRVAGARAAAALGARVIVLDGGFGHRRLHRDLDIVCIDARWPDGRGPIPAGWRRESPDALERAHWLWLNHARAPFDLETTTDLPMVRARYRPTHWLHREREYPLDARTGSVDAAAGIARPSGFLCTLLELGLTIGSHQVVPDHGKLPSLLPATVITEKDAARLTRDANTWALCVELNPEGADPLLTAIRELIE